MTQLRSTKGKVRRSVLTLKDWQITFKRLHFKYEFVNVDVCVHACAGACRGQEWVLDLQLLELQG